MAIKSLLDKMSPRLNRLEYKTGVARLFSGWLNAIRVTGCVRTGPELGVEGKDLSPDVKLSILGQKFSVFFWFTLS